MLTYGIPPEFRGGVYLFIYNRHTPSAQSRVYRVTQLRTDGVHCRESAGTGPLNLKVVPNGCCLGRSMDQLICATLSHTHFYWYEVSILKVPAYSQTKEFVYLGGYINHNVDLSIELDRRIRNACFSFWKYTLEL